MTVQHPRYHPRNSQLKVDILIQPDETLTSPEEIPEEVQSKLLAEYEKECQGRLSNDDKGELKCKEKGDMVLVSRSGESGSTSPGKGKWV